MLIVRLLVYVNCKVIGVCHHFQKLFSYIMTTRLNRGENPGKLYWTDEWNPQLAIGGLWKLQHWVSTLVSHDKLVIRSQQVLPPHFLILSWIFFYLLLVFRGKHFLMLSWNLLPSSGFWIFSVYQMPCHTFHDHTECQ